MHILSVPVLAAALMLFPTSASARSCFEDIGEKTGCPDQETFSKSKLERLSCENLWHVRNSIFADNGYCFKSTRGKDRYGNSSCSVDDIDQVKMNGHEWSNISTIRAIEREKECE